MKLVWLLFCFVIGYVNIGKFVGAQQPSWTRTTTPARPAVIIHRPPEVTPTPFVLVRPELVRPIPGPPGFEEGDGSRPGTSSDCTTVVYFAELRCEQECETEKNELKENIRTLQATVADLQNSLSEKNQENAQLTSENADLKSELQTTKTELQEQKAANEKFKNDTKNAEEEYRNSLQRYNETINILTEKFNTLKQTMRQNLTESKGENDKLQARIEEISKEKAEAEEQLKKQIDASEVLKQEVAEANDKKNETLAEVLTLKILIEQQNIQLNASVVQLEQQQKIATEATSRADECDAKLETAEDKLGNERNTVQQLQKEKKGLQSSNTALWKDLDDCNEDKIRYLHQTVTLTDALDKSEEKLKSAQAAYKRVVEVEMAQLAKQNEILQNASFLCNIRCDNLEEENHNITQTLEEHRERIEELHQVYDEIQNVKLVNLNESLNQCERDLTRAERRITELSFTKSVLESDLNSCRLNYNSTSLECMDLEEKNNKTEELYEEALTTLVVAEQAFQALKGIGIFDLETCQDFNATDPDTAQMLAVEEMAYSSRVGENDEIAPWAISFVHDANIMVMKSKLKIKPSYPEHIQRFVENEFHRFLLRLKERLCHCVHGSNCTLVPFDELYSEADLQISIRNMKREIRFPIYNGTSGAYIDVSDGTTGITALKPIEYTFLVEIRSALSEFASGDKIPLSGMRDRFIRCICRQHTFGDTCSTIKFDGNIEDLI